MKVVHICLNGPYNEGWNYQDNLLPLYHKLLGNEVSVITSPFVSDLASGGVRYCGSETYVDGNGVKIIRLLQAFSSRSVKMFKIRKYKKLYQTLSVEVPDIVFIHACQFLDIYTVKKYLKKHPQVVAYMDNHADFSNSARSWFSYHIMHRIVWKHGAQAILPYIRMYYGVIPARVDFIQKMYDIPEEKSKLLVMAADDRLVEKYDNESSKKEVREKYHIDAEDFLIVTGGKFDHAKKQVFLLMQAVEKIAAAGKKVKLLVFGSIVDDMKNEFMEIVDNRFVQYIGWINVEDSYQVFAAADLVCFPGRHSVFWEQVAGQGIPMLVKYWEGTTHVDVGGNCKFLMEDSVQEIYEKLTEIIDNKEVYDQMLKVAVEKGKKVFSYRTIARESIEMLEDVK